MDANYCDLCKLSFSTEAEFKEHSWSMLHHKKLDQEKGRNIIHNCELCDENLFALLSFAKHIHSEKHQNNLLKWKYKKVESSVNKSTSNKPTTLPLQQQQNSFANSSPRFPGSLDSNSTTYESFTSKYNPYLRTTRSRFTNRPRTRYADEITKFSSPYKYVSEQYQNNKIGDLRNSYERTRKNYPTNKNVTKDVGSTKSNSTITNQTNSFSKAQNVNGQLPSAESVSMTELEMRRVQRKDVCDSSCLTTSDENLQGDNLPEHLQGIIKRSKAAIEKIRKQRSQRRNKILLDTINSKLSKYYEDPSNSASRTCSSHGSVVDGVTGSHDHLSVNETVSTSQLSERTRLLLEKTKPVTVPIADVQDLLKKNQSIVESVSIENSKRKSQIRKGLKEDKKKKKRIRPSSQELGTSQMKRKTRKGKDQPSTVLETSIGATNPTFVTTVIDSQLQSKSTTTALFEDNNAASNETTPEDIVTAPEKHHACEFKKSDGTFCVSKTRERFCSYHKRVVQAVELYITNKVRTGTPSVSDAVSLIAMSDQESDCSVTVDVDDESSADHTFSIPMKRKRSLSDGNTSENHLIDFSRFKNSKQKKLTANKRVISPVSSRGTNGSPSPNKNVKLSRFKYLKSLSTGSHEISNMKKLPSNVRKLLDKKQHNTFQTEPGHSQESSISQSESETECSVTENSDALTGRSCQISFIRTSKSDLNEKIKTSNSMKLIEPGFDDSEPLQSNGALPRDLSSKNKDYGIRNADDIDAFNFLNKKHKADGRSFKGVVGSVNELKTNSATNTPNDVGSLPSTPPIDSAILKTLFSIPAINSNVVTTEKVLVTSHKETENHSHRLYSSNGDNFKPSDNRKTFIDKNHNSSSIYSLIHKYTRDISKSNSISPDITQGFQNNMERLESNVFLNTSDIGVVCSITSRALATSKSSFQETAAETRTVFSSVMSVKPITSSQSDEFNDIILSATTTYCNLTPSGSIGRTNSSTPKTITSTIPTLLSHDDVLACLSYDSIHSNKSSIDIEMSLIPSAADDCLNESGKWKDTFNNSSAMEVETFDCQNVSGSGDHCIKNKANVDQNSCKHKKISVQIELNSLVQKEQCIRLKLVETEKELKELQNKMLELQAVASKYNDELKNISEIKKSKIEIKKSEIKKCEMKKRLKTKIDKVTVAGCQVTKLPQLPSISNPEVYNISPNLIGAIKENSTEPENEEMSKQNLIYQSAGGINERSSECESNLQLADALPEGEQVGKKANDSIVHDSICTLEQTVDLSNSQSIEPTDSLSECSVNLISESTFQSSKYATPPSSPLEIRNLASITIPALQYNAELKSPCEQVSTEKCDDTALCNVAQDTTAEETEMIVADLDADITCMKVDGTYIYITTHRPNTLIVYDIKSKKVIKRIERSFRKRVNCMEVVYVGDIKILYVGTTGGVVHGFSVDTWRLEQKFLFGNGELLSMHFNFHILFVGFVNGVIQQIFPRANAIGKAFKRMGRKRRGISSITSASRDGIDFVYSGTNHGKIYVRSVDGNLINEIDSLGKRTVISDIKVIHYILYAVSNSRTIYGFDCMSAHLVRKINLPVILTSSPHAHAFSGCYVISLEHTTAIRCTNLLTGENEIIVISDHEADLPFILKTSNGRVFYATKSGIVKEVFLDCCISTAEDLKRNSRMNFNPFLTMF